MGEIYYPTVYEKIKDEVKQKDLYEARRESLNLLLETILNKHPRNSKIRNDVINLIYIYTSMYKEKENNCNEKIKRLAHIRDTKGANYVER